MRMGRSLPLLALVLALILSSTTAVESCSEGGYCPERTLTFTKHVIADKLDQPNSVASADLDGDGVLDGGQRQ